MKKPDYKALAKDLYHVVQDFMPNIGRCALQDYSRLNEAMVKAEQCFGSGKEGQG